MSISPPESIAGSDPLAQPPLPNPNHRHGAAAAAAPRRPSAPAAGAGAPSPPAAAASESRVTAIGEPFDASQKVVGFNISGEENGPYAEEFGNISGCQSSDQEGTSGSQLDTAGPAETDAERPELASSLQIDDLDADSSGYQGNVVQMATRRSQAVNANYLLNFQYDPISRPQPRGPRPPPPRRQRKIKPYNKDLFLQANYKFVVLDTGSYQVESMDPDKMLQWEDIVCVRYYSPSEVQCPICLESPLCPQITSCGHIYCFPCILQYLLMGNEDHRGECWKRCPLCFMMISTKELYTIFITNVKQLHVGDNATFTLLSRSKNSLAPSLKNNASVCCTPTYEEEPCDIFSKFIFSSDAELSVREAKADLNNWLRRADSGLVDDLEKLPYVCAALDQLEERMKYWTEHRNYSSSPPSKDSFSPPSNIKPKNFNDVQNSHSNGDCKVADLPMAQREMIADFSALSISPKSNKSSDKAMLSKMEETGLEENLGVSKDTNEKESYTFYQLSDGQHLILHPLNMKCLLNHFGSSDMLPHRISGKILELETVTQSEAIRKRYRFLSHFSLTTTFQLCEIDLSDVLPPSSLAPFKDEMKKREKQRKRLARKEESERVKAEVAASQASAIAFEPTYISHSPSDVMFSLDDFEALGTSAGPSTSPPSAGDRKLFSDVTRLGFASAQDSPPLRSESVDSSGNKENTRDQGPAAASPLSFASVISSARALDGSSPDVQKPNGIGRKGKKPTKVLMSTGSGRRY